MKKTTRVIAFLLVFVLVGFLSSCANNNARMKLSEFLQSHYVADVTYSIKNDNDEISGNAIISKEQQVRITFSSPDVFEGMTVENANDGQMGNIYFSYYGMRLPLPDKSLQKINLLLSLFSDETQTVVATLGKHAFENVTNEEIQTLPEFDVTSSDFDNVKLATPKKCIFTQSQTQNGMCKIIFDAASGKPYIFFATDGENEVTLTFGKIKIN